MSILFDSSAVKITGSLDATLYFLDGNVNDPGFHDVNKGNRILVALGYGVIQFSTTSGPQRHMPSPSIGWDGGAPDDPFYDLRVSNPAGASKSVRYASTKLQLTIDEDAVLSGPGPSSVSRYADFHVAFTDGASWLRQSRLRTGNSITVFYDTAWFDQAGLTQNLELRVIKASDWQLTDPPAVTSKSIPQGKGTFTISGSLLPPTTGSYMLRTMFQDRAVMGHGTFYTYSEPSPRSYSPGICSIAAGSSGNSLHLYAAVTEMWTRSLWHYQTDQADLHGGIWRRVQNNNQPIQEIEVIITATGAMLFALDETGFVRMRMGETNWQPSPWAGQLIPFLQLTVNAQVGVPTLIGMDEIGGLWTTQQTDPVHDQWVTWQELAGVTINGQRVSFKDIGSAGQFVCGVDSDGNALISADRVNWIQASLGSGQTQIPFVASDLSLDSVSGGALLWLVDEQGILWENAAPFQPADTSITITKQMSHMPPVPLDSVFCAVAHRSTTHFFSSSRGIELWSGIAGQAAWEGPTWNSLKSITRKGLDFTTVIEIPPAFPETPTLRFFALSGGALWIKAPEANGSWDAWKPYTVSGLPKSAIIKQMGQAAIGRLWAIVQASDSRYAATFTTAPNITPLWSAATVLDADFMVSTIANEETYFWQLSAAKGFQLQVFPARTRDQIDAAKPVSMAATTTVGADGYDRVIFVGLANNGMLYDLTYSKSARTAPVRSPAFGLPPPSAKLMIVRIRPSLDRKNATVLALDVNGFLWAAQQHDAGWTQPWQGPKVFSQPAQFSMFETTAQYILGTDPFGSLWLYDFATNGWSSRDWELSLALVSSNESSGSSVLAKPAVLKSATTTRNVTETRVSTFTSFPVAGRVITTPTGNKQSRFGFPVSPQTSSFLATINGPRVAIEGLQWWLYGNGIQYPLKVDQILQGFSKPKFSTRRCLSIFMPIRDDGRAVDGTYDLIIKDCPLSNGVLDPSITGYVARRQAPNLLDSGSAVMTLLGSRYTLRINRRVILWTSTTSDAEKDKYRSIVTGAQPLITNFYTGLNIAIEYMDRAITEITLPSASKPTYDFTVEPLASVIQDNTNPFAPTVVYAPRFGLPPWWTEGAPIGVAGGLGCVALPGYRCFGVAISLESVFYPLNSPTLAKNVQHELGHLLGLTHESSHGMAQNLMVSEPNKPYGNEVNKEQLWMLQQNPLVQESVSIRRGTGKVDFITFWIKTSDSTAGIFETAGTDQPIELLFWETTDPVGQPVFTHMINTRDDSFKHYEVGTSDGGSMTLPDNSQFAPHDLKTIGLSFDPSFFDGLWIMDTLEISGRVGPALAFEFKVQQDSGWRFYNDERMHVWNLNKDNTKWYV